LDNDFTPQAIESHLVYHNYDKAHVHGLIHFVVSVRNNREHIDATYSRITLFVFGLLVVLFYVLAFALELSLQILVIAFSPIIFSSVFTLGILSSDYIKNKETIWFIPFIFLFVYYFFSLSSSQIASFDLIPIMVLNLVLSLVCVGVFEFLFKSKKKALFMFKDNDRAFLALQKRRMQNSKK